MIRQCAQGDCAREGYWRLRECARASRESQQINAAYTARFHRSDSCMSVRQCAYVEVVIYDFSSFSLSLFLSFSLTLSFLSLSLLPFYFSRFSHSDACTFVLLPPPLFSPFLGSFLRMQCWERSHCQRAP